MVHSEPGAGEDTDAVVAVAADDDDDDGADDSCLLGCLMLWRWSHSCASR